MPNIILDDHVKNACQPGTKNACRYLLVGGTGKGWECGKVNPGFKELFDKRVEEKKMKAVGDNCDGVGR